jgi:hypothetical protein
MHRILHASLLIALLLVPPGCASGSAASGTAAPTASRDFITREEMEKGQYPNSYELVRSLRPHWLRVRGRDTINGEQGAVQVVLDDVRLGTTESLRTLPVSGIAYFQWLDGISATQRWGTGYGNGVILVSSRPR